MDETAIQGEALPEDRKAVFNGLLEEGIRKKDTELVTLALKNGAEPNRLLFAGITYKPGRIEKWRGNHPDLNLKWVQLALDSGADVNATKLYKDDQPWPAVHWAQAYFAPAIMGLLLDKGACVDALSPLGRTPLMDAVRNGYSEEIEFYLSRGADPLRRCAGDDFPLKALENSDKFDAAEKMRLKKLMMHHTAAAAGDFGRAAAAPEGAESQPVPGKTFSI